MPLYIDLLPKRGIFSLTAKNYTDWPEKYLRARQVTNVLLNIKLT